MKSKWKDSLTVPQQEELMALKGTNLLAYKLLYGRLHRNYTNKNLSPKAHADKLAQIRRWKFKNKDKVSASYHRTKHKHKDKVKERMRRYYLKNKAVMIPKRVAYRKNRIKTDPAFRAESNIRSRFWQMMIGRRKGRRSMEILGCNREEFRRYLESLWLPGMSWDNYGLHGWHIDHKRPCCTFDMMNDSHVKQCFHYTNMQPLWAVDNLHKQRKFFPVEPLSATG